jgi:hypothetical protein
VERCPVDVSTAPAPRLSILSDSGGAFRRGGGWWANAPRLSRLRPVPSDPILWQFRGDLGFIH